jgi:hypothetical protein
MLPGTGAAGRDVTGPRDPLDDQAPPLVSGRGIVPFITTPSLVMTATTTDADAAYLVVLIAQVALITSSWVL